MKKFLKKINKKSLIKPSVIGLGYVGLPIFLRLQRRFNTVGFDINKVRVKELSSKRDINNEFSKFELNINKRSFFTNKFSDLNNSNFFIVTVPTPIFKNNKPDLRNLISASNILKKVVKKNDIIFFESTVYPGVTKKICVPIIEKGTNLKENKDFFVGYSPERINPGDEKHKIEKINKIVAVNKNKFGISKKIYKNLAKKLIFTENIEETEASKVIENIQRDLNIGLMNEIFKVCNKAKINFKNVIKLAETKWNFVKYSPGLVGGHCLPVDPYYFSWFAKKNGINTKVILAGRNTNNQMTNYVKQVVIDNLFLNKLNISKSKILLLGLTYKKNVADIRNSLSIEVFKSLKKHIKKIKCYDPFLNNKFKKKYKLINEKDIKKFDIYIFLTNHDKFKKYKNILKNKHVIKIFP